jgi:hypothetical protein
MRLPALFLALGLAAPALGHAQKPARPRPASAQPATPATAVRPAAERLDRDPTAADDCARAKRAGRPCQLDFEGERIGGERAGGLGDFVGGVGAVEHSSLIRLRTSFRGEIVRAADRR